MYLFYSCVTNLCNLTASRDINFIKIQIIKKKKKAEVLSLILILKAKSGPGMHKTVMTKAVIFCWLLHYNLGRWSSSVRNGLPLLQSLCLSTVYLVRFVWFVCIGTWDKKIVLWMTMCLLPAGSRVVSASSAAEAGSQRSRLSFLGLYKNEGKKCFFIVQCTTLSFFFIAALIHSENSSKLWCLIQHYLFEFLFKIL